MRSRAAGTSPVPLIQSQLQTPQKAAGWCAQAVGCPMAMGALLCPAVIAFLEGVCRSAVPSWFAVVHSFSSSILLLFQTSIIFS